LAVRDPYERLGVPRGASADEIKSAYRRLARRFHPDVNPGDPTAEEQFKEVGEAYAILSDSERRQRFDRTGQTDDQPGMPGADFSGGFGDLFDMFFGGGGQRSGPRSTGRNGGDVRATIELTLNDVVDGSEKPVEVTREVECEVCHGNGTANGKPPEACPQCHGSGAVTAVRNTFIGQVRTSAPCPRCSGEGFLIPDPCRKCGGDGLVPSTSTYVLKVPAGVESGLTMQVPGQGSEGVRGGRSGDLFVNLTVIDDGRFERDGQTLFTELKLNYAQAALGDRVIIEGVDAEHEVEVPAGTPVGHQFRIKGGGLPPLHGGRRGDLIVVAGVEVPKDLTESQAKLLRDFVELRGERAPDEKAGFLSGIFKKR